MTRTSDVQQRPTHARVFAEERVRQQTICAIANPMVGDLVRYTIGLSESPISRPRMSLHLSSRSPHITDKRQSWWAEVRIVGINVASSSGNLNGRGLIHPLSLEFAYVPITEQMACNPPPPSYRQLGFKGYYSRRPELRAVRLPDACAHVDPEFQGFTYGHVKRFGDSVLWQLEYPDILFFYATLDLFPHRESWSVYVIGYFEVDHVVDTRARSNDEIRSLPGFERNAHLRHVNPRADLDLLVKGSPSSRLYRHALPLSEHGHAGRVDSRFSGKLTTVTGRSVVGGGTWHRWLLCLDTDLWSLITQHDLGDIQSLGEGP